MLKRRLVKALVLLALLAAVILLLVAYGAGQILMDLRGWLGITLNKNGTSTDVYQAYSGIIAATAATSVFAGLVVALRHLNCHTPGCWRRGTHLTAKGYKLCKVCVAKPEAALDLHDVHPSHL